MKTDFPGAGEVYDVFDEDGNRVGQATRAQVHADPSLIHRAVHVLVFRSDGRLLMQKRVMAKDVAPGKWDTSVGGHLDAGEDYLEAAYREMKEELGIEGVELTHLYDFKHRSPRESEDIRTYRVVYDGKVSPHWFEIEKVREWTVEEIDRAVGTGVFTKNFEHDWRLFRQWMQSGRRENGGR